MPPKAVRAALLSVWLCWGAGCSTVSVDNAKVSPNLRTIAAIGDRSLPVTTGAGVDAVVADREPVLPRRKSSSERISGRVVDADGEPIPNVRVRIAYGGTAGGQVVRDTTDRAGGFTLEGLSPGKSYTVIAELRDGDETIVGRKITSAPNHNIDINLSEVRKAEVDPPARGSRIDRVSKRSGNDDLDDDDSPAPPKKRKGGLNDEDIAPAEDDAADAPAAPPAPKAKRAPKSGGWLPKDGVSRTNYVPEPNEVAQLADAAPAGREPTVDDDDEADPLPPALERKPTPRRRMLARAEEPEPSEPDDAALEIPEKPERLRRRERAAGALVAAQTDDQASPPTREPEAAETEHPRPVLARRERPAPLKIERRTADPVEPANSGAPESAPETAPTPGPRIADTEPKTDAHAEVDAAQEQIPGSLLEDLPKNDSAFASNTADQAAPNTPPTIEPTAAAAAPVDTPRPTPTEKSAQKRKVTWGDLEDLAGATPAPTVAVARNPVTRATGDRQRNTPPAYESRGTQIPDTGARSPSDIRPIAPEPTRRSERPEVEFCQFDSRRGRIVDFGMYDLSGRPVRFRDIQAEVVLLDFWGTWCQPCMKSIPAIVAIQAKYGDKIQVVGIAYEEGAPAERVRKVTDTADRLKINYPILLAGIDGPCPVQQALSIKSLPTMILATREGRILWREQGAGDDLPARLEKAAAAAIRNAQQDSQ